jgi:PKD repeat protein
MSKVQAATAIIGSIIAVLTFYFSTYLPYINGQNTPATQTFTPVLEAIPNAKTEHERNTPSVEDTNRDTTQPPPEPLTASFNIDSTNGDTAPATFLFEAGPEGGTEPYTYSWDFGDGQQGNGQSITHTYVNPGTYQVTLTVTDSAGNRNIETFTITVQPPPPEGEPLTASFSVDSTNGDTAPATFAFEADAEGGTEPYTYSWDFGDGQQGNGQSITHTYVNPGTYQVTLTVTDSAGQTASDTREVIVRPPPEEDQQPPIEEPQANNT